MGGGRRACRARGAWVGALIALPVLGACASHPLIETDEGFRHARYGYQLGRPPASLPPWQRIEIENTLLAYERPGSARMTLSSRCRIPITRVPILARHLRFGIPPYTLRDSGPVEVDSLEGWQQVFDVMDRDVVVRVKTVTFVVSGCAVDWVLSVQGDARFGDAERDFDAWWSTLRPAPGADGSPRS
jgi:hypothetical protein